MIDPAHPAISFLAGALVTFGLLTLRMLKVRDTYAQAGASYAAEKVQEALDNVTPESQIERNRATINQRIATLAACESHFEDLTLAYQTNDERRVEGARDAIMGAVGSAQALMPSFVPNDMLCDAHAAQHAPEQIINRLNQMEQAHEMHKSMSGFAQSMKGWRK